MCVMAVLLAPSTHDTKMRQSRTIQHLNISQRRQYAMCTRRVKTLAPPVRQVGLPTTADGNAPALTATYDFVSVANMLNTKHYPRMGVGVIYETT